jgi:SAM-dependent methyltransferase
MSGFSVDWLSLREAADAAARAGSLVEQLLHVTAAREPRRIVDLGAGTGANLRDLAPLLGGRQSWRLVDRDADLLDATAACLRAWGKGAGVELTEAAGELVMRGEHFECRLQFERRDLASELATVALPTGALVSASALLDLVSEPWLQALARRSFEAAAPVLFALTYDGRVVFSPPDPEDELVRTLVNRHQRTGKGFGSALGPAAAQCAAGIFRELGYRVRTAASDWHLGSEDPALQTALVEGWIRAAGEVAPAELHRLEGWRARRRRHIDRGDCTLTVGHIDMLGWLPER